MTIGFPFAYVPLRLRSMPWSIADSCPPHEPPAAERNDPDDLAVVQSDRDGVAERHGPDFFRLGVFARRARLRDLWPSATPWIAIRLTGEQACRHWNRGTGLVRPRVRGERQLIDESIGADVGADLVEQETFLQRVRRARDPPSATTQHDGLGRPGSRSKSAISGYWAGWAVVPARDQGQGQNVPRQSHGSPSSMPKK